MNEEVKNKNLKYKNDEENGFEFEDIQLNDMFSLSYNFDILKMIINNLVKNQQKLNCRLIELKIDKVYNQIKIDELESNIIDLKKSFNNQENKIEVLKKKDKLKEYKELLDKLIKEKDYFLSLINNSSQERIILNEKNHNTIEKETNEYEEKINGEIKEEINVMFNGLKGEVDGKINNNSQIIEKKIENIEKMISLINNEMKISENKINLKFSEELPKIFENMYSNKITIVNSKIDDIEQNEKQNIKNLENQIKGIKENNQLEELKLQDNIKENQKVFKELFKQSTKLEQKINDCVQIKAFNSSINEIESKIKRENIIFNNNFNEMKENLEKIENEISNIVRDKSNKGKILLLSEKCDNLNADIIKLKDLIMLYDADRKKLSDIDPNKFTFKIDFDEFKESNDKIIENIKQYLNDINHMMDDIRANSSKGMATIKDLKNLEDKIICKMFEFGEQMNEKFAEKKFVLRNNRFLKIEIKQKLDNYKNNEQRSEGAGWLLTKKPIGGHLCASCEAYIGDLKENLKDNEKYIPWNKYHKEQNEKLNKISPVFTKMLQKLSTDYKIRRNNSNLEMNITKLNPDNSLDDIEIKQCQTNLTNKRKVLNIKDKIYGKNIKKRIKIKDIPKLKILKKDDVSKNKNKAFYDGNSKTERDETIVLPEPVLVSKKREGENIFEPKVMKVFKKLI